MLAKSSFCLVMHAFIHSIAVLRRACLRPSIQHRTLPPHASRNHRLDRRRRPHVARRGGPARPIVAFQCVGCI